MLIKDIKFILDCIRNDTISFNDKLHCESLLLAELERLELQKIFAEVSSDE